MARIVRQSKVWHDLERELPPGLEELFGARVGEFSVAGSPPAPP